MNKLEADYHRHWFDSEYLINLSTNDLKALYRRLHKSMLQLNYAITITDSYALAAAKELMLGMWSRVICRAKREGC